MPPNSKSPWLTCSTSTTADGNYHHFHLVEDVNGWIGERDGVIEYFKAAHSDTIQHLRDLVETSLHPTGQPQTPYSDYPHILPTETLQGYFGEIIAGWFAENRTPSGQTGWIVPAHLCRFHLTALQYLERLAQTGTAPARIVGRTGDDCLAFIRDANGTITDILFCEAKCTDSHDASLIADAHDKASNGVVSDLPRLMEILLDRGTQDALSWLDSLRELYLKLRDRRDKSVKRHDLVCYVHSQVPKQKGSWIPTESPHTKYAAKRILNAVELRLANVVGRLEEVYAPEVWQ